MNKQELLKQIEELSAQNNISAEDLIQAHNQGQVEGTAPTPIQARPGNQIQAPETLNQLINSSIPDPKQVNKNTSQSVKDWFSSNWLYKVGGAAIFLGFIALFWSSWESVPPFIRAITVLLPGVIVYIISVLFAENEEQNTLSQALCLISAPAILLGLMIVFSSMGWNTSSPTIQLITAITLTIVYGSYALAFRKNVSIILSSIFIPWALYALASLVFKGQDKIIIYGYVYLSLIIGLGFLATGYYYMKKEANSILDIWFNNVGLAYFLGSLIALVGWDWGIKFNYFWMIITPLLILGTVGLSAVIKKQNYLLWGQLFLITYIIMISDKFLADSFGWPLALITIGIVFIGVGALTVYLNKEIKGTENPTQQSIN